MRESKIIILVGVLTVFSAYGADTNTPDYIDMQLDGQINELTARRDKLKADIEACEKNTRGFKIAGISTLAATGVGVVGNIKLASEIEKQKTLKGHGGAGGGRGRSAGGGGLNLSQEQKDQMQDDMFCAEAIADNACSDELYCLLHCPGCPEDTYCDKEG